MPLIESILATQDCNQLYDLIMRQDLRFKLDRAYGWEKIESPLGEEFFDLMAASRHVNQVYERSLSSFTLTDIERGEKVCLKFRAFWYELAAELPQLDCLVSARYRFVHSVRYITIISDWNQEWTDLWSADIMLRPSWYAFGALTNFERARKALQ